MKQITKQDLNEIIEGFSPEDLHALVTYAKFIKTQQADFIKKQNERLMTEEEHAQMMEEFNAVVKAASKTGTPISNLDHDKYLYDKP